VTGRPTPWEGVAVAITTPFAPDLAVDLPALGEHARWMVDLGIRAVVVGGSLGEGATLTDAERLAMLAAVKSAVGTHAPVVLAVASARTSGAVELARAAVPTGADGLLVLPPYVYRGDRREVHEHFRAVIRATELPCMLYNNPAAYGTDVTPDDVLELAEELPTLSGVKESSGDVRRITALRALLGGRVEIAVGLDDAVLEGVRAGAVGWVAGLANALPLESVELFERITHGASESALELYRWFLPLLRMDTQPKFVQLIKQVETEVGRGPPRVRPPRLPLAGEELAEARRQIGETLSRRPDLSSRRRSTG
jgi:1-pyrroline-4-hydroxy-2-carboxylate deaminase